MKPRKSPHKNRQRGLFRPELLKIVDPGQGLVKLSKAVDWDHLDELFDGIMRSRPRFFGGSENPL